MALHALEKMHGAKRLFLQYMHDSRAYHASIRPVKWLFADLREQKLSERKSALPAQFF